MPARIPLPLGMGRKRHLLSVWYTRSTVRDTGRSARAVTPDTEAQAGEIVGVSAAETGCLPHSGRQPASR